MGSEKGAFLRRSWGTATLKSGSREEPAGVRELEKLGQGGPQKLEKTGGCMS